MLKQSAKARKKSRGNDKQPGVDNLHRDTSGQLRDCSGNTRIDTLREKYGDDFAPGIRGDAHLKTLLDRTRSGSLSDYLKAAENDRKNRADDPVGMRYASDDQFQKAHGKTTKLHAGLFRRLAE